MILRYSLVLCCLFVTISVFSQFQEVELIREFDDKQKEYKIYVANHSFSSQIVTLTFKDEINIKCRDGNKVIVKTIRGGNRSLFTKISALDPNRSFNFGYGYTYRPGVLRPKPDFDYPYLIPLKPDAKTSIRTMTYLNSKYGTEEIPKDWYSITFSANEGDTICAARGGVVSLIVENNEESTKNGLLFERNSNYLIIEHKDGTFADYKLFVNNGIIVKEGDQIIPGQALGIGSGSNYANGSHLRFNIRYYHNEDRKEKKHPWAYVKANFLTTDGIHTLEVNSPYTAVISDEIITYEMSRREKKKYLKSKSQ